jgi:hypothetical protein
MLEQNWNTWDVSHLNGMVHLSSGVRVCFHLFNPATGEVKDRFDWRNNLHRLGPHAAGGSYLQITLQWQDALISFEAASQGEQLAVRLTPLRPSALRVFVTLDRAWEMAVETAATTDYLTAVISGQKWKLGLVESAAPLLTTHAQIPAFSLSLDRSLVFWVAPDPQTERGFPDPLNLLETQRLAYEASGLHSAGWLQDAADGITRALHWNTIWEPIKGRVCSPVSREWCVDPSWGGYVLFDWDTFFAALMAGLEEPALAAANVHAILQEVTPRGFIPNYGSARQQSLDRSQPPVGAYCVLKLYRARRLMNQADENGRGNPLNRTFLTETFPALLRWHQWWLPNRDGNRDGLLEWGSDPFPGELGWEVDTLRAAMYESGLDNSPMYDDAVFNPLTHTMQLADVGLNALYALDAWALSEIARELGQTATAEMLQSEYQQLGERINAFLWNEEAGIYQNRDWDGHFSPHLSPTNFYPLLAGIAPPERAVRMVREHLLNENEFWGRFVIPSIAKNDPGYHQSEVRRDGIAQPIGEYWRGRIWGPMNFLVSEGLRRSGLDAESHQFARRSLDLFLQEWQTESHVHENYHDLSGEGDDAQNSNPVYHWGALLAYLGIQELADHEAWAGWRFGSPATEPAEIQRIRIQEGYLSVQSGPAGLKVWLNNVLLLSADHPAWVRGYRYQKGQLNLQLLSENLPVCLTIGGMPSSHPINYTWWALTHPAQEKQSFETDSSGQICLQAVFPGEIELNWDG